MGKTSTPKRPKDIGLKIGSKLQVWLREGRHNTVALIENGKHSLAFNKRILKLIDEMIEEEKEKFK